MSERMSYLIVLIGAILWGTTGTAQTFIPETVDPFIISTMRLMIGGFSLFLILSIFGKVNLSKWPWKYVIVVAIALAIFQYLFFTSVRLTGVAIGTVVSIGSAPVFTGIMEWVESKILPSRQWFIATFLAIFGSSLLFLNKESVVFNSTGVIFALLAGLLFAIYTFTNKVILQKGDAIQAVAIVFTISACLLLPFVFRFSSEGLGSVPGMMAIIYIGLITTAISYVLFSIGLKSIPSSSATTLSLAEPFTATILSVIVVGEILNMTAWIGVMLMLSGIIVLTIRRNQPITNH